MTDKKQQSEEHEKLRDLDVREEQAESVKGGLKVGDWVQEGHIKGGMPSASVTADAHSGNDN